MVSAVAVFVYVVISNGSTSILFICRVYTVSKVLDRIGIIKLIPVSYQNDTYTILLTIHFDDDINK